MEQGGDIGMLEVFMYIGYSHILELLDSIREIFMQCNVRSVELFVLWYLMHEYRRHLTWSVHLSICTSATFPTAIGRQPSVDPEGTSTTVDNKREQSSFMNRFTMLGRYTSHTHLIPE